MTIFFYLHRTRCVVMAFSIFALAEYVFGLSNVLFHLTIIYDLPEVQIDIAFAGLRKLSNVSSVVSTRSAQHTSVVAAALIPDCGVDFASTVSTVITEAPSGTLPTGEKWIGRNPMSGDTLSTVREYQELFQSIDRDRRNQSDYNASIRRKRSDEKSEPRPWRDEFANAASIKGTHNEHTSKKTQ
ncbi:post-GPI attachment to proteins factor 2-like [Tropilaelaps mercedesae]|uniref:Post-GPI attachment to proteins factor 2-like n=1 Tax=Tropilaelaps mercedesae TaxID=418985 RepID=A0A1V9X8Q3_9ACAR|nr:post-GPI attachment to proteins factor 2-like [Tropilaelaps mercedesae]